MWVCKWHSRRTPWLQFHFQVPEPCSKWAAARVPASLSEASTLRGQRALSIFWRYVEMCPVGSTIILGVNETCLWLLRVKNVVSACNYPFNVFHCKPKTQFIWGCMLPTTCNVSVRASLSTWANVLRGLIQPCIVACPVQSNTVWSGRHPPHISMV